MSSNPQMRGRLGGLLLASVVGTVHAGARAQGNEGLRVERAAGAETCPDALGLGQRIAAIRGRPRASSSAGYEVGFDRTGDTFRATIRGGPGGESERVLDGRGSCSALAQATAVTLALLLDSEAERASKPETQLASPPPPARGNPRPLPVTRAPESSAARLDGTLSVGAAGLAFVLRPLSPAFAGEFGVRFAGFRAGIGVLWNPPQSLPLDSGQLNVSLLSGTLRACVTLKRASRIELDLCSGLIAGAVTGKADGPGITDNAARTRAYLALPVELSLAQLSSPFGWEVGAGALAGLSHHDFEVEGLPTAYRAPRVGAMLSFRAHALWPW